MDKFNYYVVSWNPNGTNDLIITDKDSQIVDSLECATFGIDVMKGQYGDDLIVTDSESVFTTNREDFEESESIMIVRQVSVDELIKFRACSPVDPSGRELLRKLESYGIDHGR